MIAYLFDRCVDFLNWLAKKTDPWFPGGMDYVKINVILFCMVLPVVLITSLGLNALFIFGAL